MQYIIAVVYSNEWVQSWWLLSALWYKEERGRAERGYFSERRSIIISLFNPGVFVCVYVTV